MVLQVATRVDRQVAVIAAPFGAVAVETDAERVCALRFLPATPEVQPSNDLSIEAVEQLKRYFADPRFRFELPLDLRGSAFQCRVWDAISAIPSGTTRRYGELATELVAPARAVGQACGDNRLPIVIPCHRVIGADSLGGFAHASSGFALSVKRWLLEHEGALRGTLI
jgi:methylated-DNA-[protein]-cysteine S-methyltransferase